MSIHRHDLGPATILEGDVRECLRTLPDEHFHCVVTSPPYWALRSYLPADHELKAYELGSEPTPDAYVATMVDVFREVRRVLRSDGLCWVDIGDSYAQAGHINSMDVDAEFASAKARAAEHGYNVGGWGAARSRNQGAGGRASGSAVSGLVPGDLCLVPSRLALALQADGWIVRQIVIWDKPAPMPESVSGTRWERCRQRTWPHADTNTAADLRRDRQQGRDFGRPKVVECPGCDKCCDTGGYVLRRGSWRCTTAHEYILMLVKSLPYFADQEAVKEEAGGRGPGNVTGGKWGSMNAVGGHMPTELRGPVTSRNPRSLWRTSSEPLKEKHYAAFPSKLPERCIAASTSAKGCCPTCGAQWARIAETRFVPGQETNNYCKVSENRDNNRDPSQTPRGTVSTKTLGWRPTCDCPAHEPEPARVLDPFGGSGTTALQALRMGRRATIIELNPEYVAMAAKRIRKAFGLLAV